MVANHFDHFSGISCIDTFGFLLLLSQSIFSAEAKSGNGGDRLASGRDLRGISTSVGILGQAGEEYAAYRCFNNLI